MSPQLSNSNTYGDNNLLRHYKTDVVRIDVPLDDRRHPADDKIETKEPRTLFMISIAL